MPPVLFFIQDFDFAMTEPISLKEVCNDLIAAGYYAYMASGDIHILTSPHTQDTKRGYSIYRVTYYDDDLNRYNPGVWEPRKDRITMYYSGVAAHLRSEVISSSSDELIKQLPGKIKMKNELEPEIKHFEERDRVFPKSVKSVSIGK